MDFEGTLNMNLWGIAKDEGKWRKMKENEGEMKENEGKWTKDDGLQEVWQLRKGGLTEDWWPFFFSHQVFRQNNEVFRQNNKVFRQVEGYLNLAEGQVNMPKNILYTPGIVKLPLISPLPLKSAQLNLTHFRDEWWEVLVRNVAKNGGNLALGHWRIVIKSAEYLPLTHAHWYSISGMWLTWPAALYPPFWIFLRSRPVQNCCSSSEVAIRSISLAVVGS